MMKVRTQLLVGSFLQHGSVGPFTQICNPWGVVGTGTLSATLEGQAEAVARTSCQGVPVVPWGQSEAEFCPSSFPGCLGSDISPACTVPGY